MPRATAHLSQYRDVGLAGSLSDASPHRLVGLLLQGARARLRAAAVAIGDGDLVRKAKAIHGAYAILEHLRVTLDHRAGGEVAGGLDALYEYSGRRLVEANAGSDITRLGEVDGLLQRIESAWQQLPESAPA